MKTSFLGLALLCPALTFALDNPADSILVKVGKRASVTFYGEKKADLKSLEQYDWNAIVRDMNARLGLTTPAEPRQHYVDLLGNSYLADSALRKGGSVVKVTEREADRILAKGQVKRGLEQLKASILFAYGFAGMVNQPAYGYLVNSPYELRKYSLLQSRNIAVGIQKYTILTSSKNASFGIRWGGKVEWLSYRFQQRRSLIWIGTEEEVKSLLAEQQSVSSGQGIAVEPAGPGITVRDRITGELQPAWFYYKEIEKRKSISSYLTLPIVPTVQFYNSEGRRTWFLGIGGYFSYLLRIRSRTDFADSKLVEYINGPRTRYGATANIGYRGTSVFFNFDLTPKSPNQFAFGIMLNGL